MFELKNKIKVFDSDLKCVTDNFEWAGGLKKAIKNIKTGFEIQTNSFVNSTGSCLENILFGLADGRLALLNKNNEMEYVNIHKQNICGLDCYEEYILTCSWDCSAILLLPVDQNNADLCLGGKYYSKKEFKHPKAVWKAKFIDKNCFITACADNSIRIFKNQQLFKEFNIHSNVVRGVYFIENTIFSVDNYGKLLKTSLNGKILKNRSLNEMCFDMCEYNGLILICGENGMVFASNLDLEILFNIKLPCLSCWSIKVINNEILVSGSDGEIYVLSVDKNIEMQPISNINDIKNERSTVKTFVSEGVKYKKENNKIYKETESGWELVGDSQVEWDHSFSVELDDKTYTLSFNNDENVHDVATRFINSNKINKVHHQEIVDYINKNFKKSTLYKKYDTINIDGITKIISDKPIVNIIKNILNNQIYSIYKCNENNIYQIEEALFDFKNMPVFVILDICKFLYAKKIFIDLSFLFDLEISSDKEAKAFVFLMTNLVEDSPFNLSKLDLKIKQLRDLGMLTLENISKYDDNYRIKNNK